MTSESRDLSAILRRTMSWWLPLGIVMMAVTILANPGFPAWRSGWGLVDLALSRLGFTLPFLAFVTGVAAVRPGRDADRRLRASTTTRVVLASGLLAIVGYAISTVAEPLAEHRFDEERGTVVAEQLHYGPSTPLSLLRQLRASKDTPPDNYTFSTARPNDRPPNWLATSDSWANRVGHLLGPERTPRLSRRTAHRRPPADPAEAGTLGRRPWRVRLVPACPRFPHRPGSAPPRTTRASGLPGFRSCGHVFWY